MHAYTFIIICTDWKADLRYSHGKFLLEKRNWKFVVDVQHTCMHVWSSVLYVKQVYSLLATVIL
jgi:hypothetical protein